MTSADKPSDDDAPGVLEDLEPTESDAGEVKGGRKAGKEQQEYLDPPK